MHSYDDELTLGRFWAVAQAPSRLPLRNAGEARTAHHPWREGAAGEVGQKRSLSLWLRPPLSSGAAWTAVAMTAVGATTTF